MDWTEQFDGYCERTDFTFWAEPINAVTNLAFIVAALIMWRRTAGMPLARVMCAILFAIGVGSFLFHTYATAWAALADVAPIGLFILVYIFAANLRFLGWPLWAALVGTLGFLPYAAGVTVVLDDLPFFSISNFYWSVPVLIFAYAAYLSQRAPQTARGMAAGAALLCLSITIRSLDEPLCEAIHQGIHFLWHILNGIMLGWMIEVYRRHILRYSMT